jgi:hypothetical protein
MLEFSSTESCTTGATSTPLVGFSSNDSSCDGNVALMNDFESTGGCSGQGPQGPQGFSAYQIAVFEGFVGTEEEWLASLVGPGVPVGGTAGQILAKINSTNYNTQWINSPSLTGYVPYIGATQDLNLGEWELKAGQLSLDITPTGIAAVGTTRWNNTIGSSETTLKGGTVILKNGVDLVARVVNKVTPNTTLTKAAYQAVRISGAQGQRLAIDYAQANNDNNSADTIGLVTETIATNQEGFIMTVGQLEEINTTGSLQGETWVDGSVLYLSPTTPGALTNIKPTGLTGHIVVMGYVEYAHAIHGKIYVKIMNGWEIDELHNVYAPSPLNNDGLFYETSSSLWKNKSISTVLGYTPFNLPSLTSGSVLFSNGTTIAQNNANFFWNNANNRLGIGTTTPSYALHVNGVTGATTFTIPSYNSQLNQNYLMLYGGYGAGMQGTYNNPTGGDLTFGTFINSIFNEKMRLLPSGNLGIGTVSPIYNLDVNGTSRFVGNLQFELGIRDNRSNTIITQSLSSLLSNRSLTIGNATYSSIIFPNGNVGIGTSTPNTKAEVYRLETVNRTSYSDILTISAGANTNPFTGHGGGILFRATNYISGTTLVDSARIGSTITNNSVILTGADLFFDVSPLQDGVLSRAMTIKYNGAIGIGTTTPQQILDVYSTSNYQGILVRGSVAPSIGFVRNAGTASEWKIGISGNFGSNLAISSGTVATDVMTFGASGVGIGVTNATSKLDILDTVLAGSAALAGSVLNLAQTWNTTGVPTALLLNVTDTASNGFSKLFDFQVGGLSQLTLFKDGRLQMKSNTALNSAGNSVILRTNLQGGTGYNLDVASYNNFNTSSLAQGFANFSGNIFYPAGTGVFKGINVTYTINNPGVQTGRATGIFLNATETALNGMGHNLMDLQIGGASRFIVNNVGSLFTNNFAISRDVSTGADGNVVLSNSGVTNFGLLKLGGTTSSFPAIKRNGAGIDFVVADDSAYCNIRTAAISATSIYNNVGAYYMDTFGFVKNVNTNTRLNIFNNGYSIELGASNVVAASAIFELKSTTQGFLPPRMTTAQKVGIATPATGLVVFDTDLGKLCVFAVTWQTITSA